MALLVFCLILLLVLLFRCLAGVRVDGCSGATAAASGSGTKGASALWGIGAAGGDGGGMASVVAGVLSQAKQGKPGGQRSQSPNGDEACAGGGIERSGCVSPSDVTPVVHWPSVLRDRPPKSTSGSSGLGSGAGARGPPPPVPPRGSAPSPSPMKNSGGGSHSSGKSVGECCGLHVEFTGTSRLHTFAYTQRGTLVPRFAIFAILLVCPVLLENSLVTDVIVSTEHSSDFLHEAHSVGASPQSTTPLTGRNGGWSEYSPRSPDVAVCHPGTQSRRVLLPASTEPSYPVVLKTAASFKDCASGAVVDACSSVPSCIHPSTTACGT